MSLPLRYALPPAVLRHTCETCGRVDSAGTMGPVLHSERVNGVLRPLDEPRGADWLCGPHSREAWGAYLRERRLRRQLIQVSAWLGYPATTADVQRLRRAGEQVALGGGW